MDDRIRPEHLCSPSPVGGATLGTVWRCRHCGAGYTRANASWVQTKKPHSRIWAAVVLIFDGASSIP